MLSIAATALVVLPLMGLPGAAAQPDANQVQQQAEPAQSAPPAGGHSIWVQPMTVLDQLETLGGHLVELAPCRVERVLSATLVELRDARERGRYRFRQWDGRDTLLALLPAGARVLKGDTIVVTGRVRTVAGAALDTKLAGLSDEVLEDRRHHALLVATSVHTVDGVSMR